MEPAHATGSNDRPLAVAIFLLAWVVYGYFWGGGGWGQNAHLALTRALVEEQTIFVDPWARATGDLSLIRGRAVINKPPGLSMLGAVPWSLSSVASDDSTWRAWIVNVFSNALVTAAAPALLFLFARGAGLRRSRAVVAALTLAFATPLLPYATLLLVHAMSGALLFAAWMFARSPRRSAFGAGLLAGLAALSNFVCIPLVAVIALAAGWMEEKRFDRRRLVLALAGAAGPLLLFALYQWLAMGRVFVFPFSHDPKFTSKGAIAGVLVGPSMDALWGITFSPYKGLFYLAPVLLVSLLGFAVGWREKRFRDLFVIGSVVAVFFAVNLSFNNWDGGFGIGARYLVTIVPFLGAAIVFALRRVNIPLFALLTLLSFVNVFAATAVDPQPSGSIPHPLEDYVYPSLVHGRFVANWRGHPRWAAELMRGHTSLPRQTVDEIVPFARHAPGSPEAEWASFNLGELMTGPGDARSVLPVLGLILGGSGMLLAAARRADRGSPDR